MSNGNSQNNPSADTQDKGYYFYPPAHPHSPGHPRLDIYLRSAPTEQHFDPEQVKFAVVDPLDNGLHHLAVDYFWEGRMEHRLVIGRVTMIDRRGKTAEAFTFGGDLQIQRERDELRCIVKSPAPILSLISDQGVLAMLAQEVEVLLSERRAAWAADLDKYEQRLVAADPAALYFACLAALRERFEHFPTVGEDRMQRFIHFLRVDSLALSPYFAQTAESQRLQDIL